MMTIMMTSIYLKSRVSKWRYEALDDLRINTSEIAYLLHTDHGIPSHSCESLSSPNPPINSHNHKALPCGRVVVTRLGRIVSLLSAALRTLFSLAFHSGITLLNSAPGRGGSGTE